MKNNRKSNNYFSNPFSIATVVNNSDPENAYRVQVRIPVLHDSMPDKILPWAARVGPSFLGFGDADIDHAIPENGTKVLVLAVNNNPNSLLYLGSLYSKNSHTPSGGDYLGSYGIYTKNGEFIGVDKIKNVFHMLWNGDLVLDVKGKVKIGDKADEPAVLGTKLETLLNSLIGVFNSHTHTGNLGIPTSPPSTPMVYQDVTSKKITLE